MSEFGGGYLGNMVKLSLDVFVPSDDEVAKAKAVIASATDAAKRSKIASTVQFVKTDPKITPDEKSKFFNSRGEERQNYLRKYVSHQIAGVCYHRLHPSPRRPTKTRITTGIFSNSTKRLAP